MTTMNRGRNNYTKNPIELFIGFISSIGRDWKIKIIDTSYEDALLWQRNSNSVDEITEAYVCFYGITKKIWIVKYYT